MKRIKWDNNQGSYSVSFSISRPGRRPDFTCDFGGGDLWEYWWKEMFAIVRHPEPSEKEYYVMGVCPGTNLLMYIENGGSDWSLDLEEAQIAYMNWCAEDALLGNNKTEERKK